MNDSSALQGAPLVADFEAMTTDPHGYYRKYRPLTPVLQNGQNFYVLRARDVFPMQKNPKMQQIEGWMMKFRGYPEEGHMWRLFSNTVLMSNGKVHARRRAPAVDAFSRRMIAKLREHIRLEARRLAEALPRGVDFDFLEHFASPLPGRVIAFVVGLDPDLWQRFATLVYKMTQGLAPPFPADKWEEIEAAAGEMLGFVEQAIAARRAAPQDDFLTAYIAAADKTGAMDAEELLIQIVGLLLAGSDTTRAGLAVQQGILLEERSRWEAVLADRSLMSAAISESLRLEPPVGGSPRMVVEDVDVGGVTIPAGSAVDLLSISAMRDPEIYDRPDDFDMHRTGVPTFHPVFGGGVHRCLGEQLALAELEEGMAAILDIAPTIRLVGKRAVPRGFTAVREMFPLIVHID